MLPFLVNEDLNLNIRLFDPIWSSQITNAYCKSSGSVSQQVKANIKGLTRGHSRNWPKGGRNSPQRFISTRFADHFSQFLPTKSSEASSRSFICGNLDKTSFHTSHHVV